MVPTVKGERLEWTNAKEHARGGLFFLRFCAQIFPLTKVGVRVLILDLLTVLLGEEHVGGQTTLGAGLVLLGLALATVFGLGRALANLAGILGHV